MENISYISNVDELKQFNVGDFFDEWDKRPSEKAFRKLLENSYAIECAVDVEKKLLIGYITALSDGVLSSYIPFLEVDKSYQGKGIGSELLNRMLKRSSGFYMTDLVADEEKAGFYEKAGMRKWNAMIVRRYDRQGGVESSD